MADVDADDFDKEQLEQLHAATLKAADSCFELKKLCATVLVPTGTLVALLTDKKLDWSIFVAGLVVIVAFWLADSVGYYYQRKLRNAMAAIWQRRAGRVTPSYGHVPEVVRLSPLRAAFNASMIYYAILVAVITLGSALFASGLLG